MSTQTDNKEGLHTTEQEIDLIALIGKLWSARKFILKVTACFMVVGLLIALFSAKQYTASCVIVPQMNKSTSSSSMARLASLAGINMGSLSTGEQLISPLVYPNVLESNAFQRELLQTKIHVKESEEPITLLTYLTDDEYKKFSLTGTVLKYTIGLPGMIVKAIRGEQPNKTEQLQALDKRIIVLTKEEQQAVRQLNNLVSITLEEKKGYITITTLFDQPYAAAQITENTLSLLQKYITEFKLDKVQSNLEFVQGRYDVLKAEYEEAQMARARFMDANMNTVSSRARSEYERLNNQYTLAYNVFSEIATQLEQTKIQVKEDTPVLTVISPVTMPSKPSKPQRMLILVGFTFLGGVAGCGYVLVGPFLREAFGSARKKEDEE